MSVKQPHKRTSATTAGWSAIIDIRPQTCALLPIIAMALAAVLTACTSDKADVPHMDRSTSPIAAQPNGDPFTNGEGGVQFERFIFLDGQAYTLPRADGREEATVTFSSGPLDSEKQSAPTALRAGIKFGNGDSFSLPAYIGGKGGSISSRLSFIVLDSVRASSESNPNDADAYVVGLWRGNTAGLDLSPNSPERQQLRLALPRQPETVTVHSQRNSTEYGLILSADVLSKQRAVLLVGVDARSADNDPGLSVNVEVACGDRIHIPVVGALAIDRISPRPGGDSDKERPVGSSSGTVDVTVGVVLP